MEGRTHTGETIAKLKMVYPTPDDIEMFPGGEFFMVLYQLATLPTLCCLHSMPTYFNLKLQYWNNMLKNYVIFRFALSLNICDVITNTKPLSFILITWQCMAWQKMI